MSIRPDRKIHATLAVLTHQGCNPVEVAPGRWLALCPCCGKLDLIIQSNGGAASTPPTNAERDMWLDAWGAAA